MSGRPRHANDPSVMASFEAALTAVPRASVFGMIWNWRYELLLLAAVTGAAVGIALELGIAWLVGLAAAAVLFAAALLAWQPARGRIIARAWCIITPHRIRVGCLHSWVQTRYGRLPVVLYTAPTVFGERALLWCRAGITAGDLVAAREILTAACWAIDVRVVPSQRHPHIVALEVIRREPGERPAGPGPGWPYFARADTDGADPEEPAPWRWQGEPAARSAS
jgi:hypothetical protein